MASVERGQSPPRAGSASPGDRDPGQGALPEPRRPFRKARLVAVMPSQPGGCGRGYRKHKPCVWHTAALRWSDLITRGGYVPGPSPRWHPLSPWTRNGAAGENLVPGTFPKRTGSQLAGPGDLLRTPACSLCPWAPGRTDVFSRKLAWRKRGSQGLPFKWSLIGGTPFPPPHQSSSEADAAGPPGGRCRPGQRPVGSGVSGPSPTPRPGAERPDCWHHAKANLSFQTKPGCLFLSFSPNRAHTMSHNLTQSPLKCCHLERTKLSPN